jgi:hypothetical protein
MIKPAQPLPFPWVALAAAIVVAAGNLWAPWIYARDLYQMPIGSSGRLIISAVESGLVCLVTLLLGGILSTIVWRYEKRRILAACLLFFSLTPFFVANFTLWHVAAHRNITLKG